MSYAIGKAAMHLQRTERVARTEYTDSWEIIRYYGGGEPRVDGAAWQRYYQAVHLDYLWTVNDGPVALRDRGRTTDMGHASYMEDGSDFHRDVPSPFASSDDVLNFNAVQEYGLPDFKDLVAYYEQWYQDLQRTHDLVISGGYYKTLISGAIEMFGWERLLEAAGDDPDRFGEDVLGAIFDLSLHHYQAWAETSIEVFMCHDDMVWTSGPFMHPDFYRKYIFPRYRELWRPLKAAGKRILYTADGTYDMFADDIVATGADGLCFEPTNDLEMLVRKYGQTHVLLGGADCRTLTFGAKADIEQEVTHVFDLARDCPGFFFATGNHLPANIPLENAIFYFELADRLGQR